MCNSCRCDKTLGCATIVGVMRHLDFNNYRFDETLGCATIIGVMRHLDVQQLQV